MSAVDGSLTGRRVPGVLVRVLLLAGLAYLGVQVVMANSAELSGAASYLESANWGWIGLAALAEAGSYLNFTLLQRRLLAAGGVRVGMLPLAGMSLAGSAITNSLPGGGAFATVFAYRQFRRRGADEALTTWTIMAFTALTSIALALLAVLGLLVAGSDSGVGGLWILIVPLVVGPACGVVLLLRPRLLGPILKPPVRWWKRLTGRPRSDPDANVDDLVARLDAVTPRVSDWLWGLIFATGNWAADCPCLLLAFAAVHAPIPWRGLLVAYGAAQVASNLPITPGGLGVVEGSLTVALVAFGGSTEETVAAVLLYRIVSFWLTMPIGWAAWLVLQWDVRRHPAPEKSRRACRGASGMRRLLTGVLGVLVVLGATSACEKVNGVASSVSPCFRVLPQARAALGGQGTFVDVARVRRSGIPSIPGFTRRPRAASTTSIPPSSALPAQREVCLVAYRGTFDPSKIPSSSAPPGPVAMRS